MEGAKSIDYILLVGIIWLTAAILGVYLQTKDLLYPFRKKNSSKKER